MFSQEGALTIDNLKIKISNLTANQLEDKIKHLNHGVSFPPVPSLDICI
jgi:hypothetical protein